MPDLPPVKTRLPLAAWAFAGAITLCSIVSLLMPGWASGDIMTSFEQQAKASVHGVMAATMLR
jgi:hypothetical protein